MHSTGLATVLTVVTFLAASIQVLAQGPCLSAEFTLQMDYSGANLSLGAIDSGTTGMLYIVGYNPDSYRGTPVQASGNGTAGTAKLDFDIRNNDDCETQQTGLFGLYAPDLGERYGAQSPITATKGLVWPHWHVGYGEVLPRLTAASQWYYACPLAVNGTEYIGLSWGVYNSNGSAPFGCEPTSVTQTFNLPCSF